MNIIYTIDRPYEDGIIEVYTPEDGGACYEWRIIERGEIIKDSGNHGGWTCQQYGSPGVALRDALNHDEPPEPPMSAAVPISWIPGRDASSENLTQVWRTIDTLRIMATDLVSEAYNAKVQRRVMNPDHPNGRLGMIYTDKRTATTEHVAQALNDAADKLLIHAHEMNV